MSNSNKNFLQYMVGGLLYMPAFQENIVDKIKNNSIKCLNSIALCLEDSIRDEALDKAEYSLINILNKLKLLSENNVNLPLIFVRVRSPEHLKSIHYRLSDLTNVLTGYILPKFDLHNIENYSDFIYDINLSRQKKLYIMPILETKMIADVITRNESLIKIKCILDKIKDYVLNIRVGVNDLSNIYGLRYDINHNIYDIGIIRDVLISILNIFAKDYVVAGPVWNYFGNDNNCKWSEGLKRELALDRINGFIGKSAINPSQLPYIFENLKVNQTDLNDANQILNWQSDSHGVAKGSDRMNELKCHYKWAERIKILSTIYGVRNDLSN